MLTRSVNTRHSPNGTYQKNGKSIEIRNLHTWRRGLHLIDNLSIKVTAGEVLGISGPSGCGKTTLLRVIAGLDNQFNGTVTVPTGMLAMVFQEPRLLPWATAYQNIEIAVSHRIGKLQAKQAATRWLQAVGLKDAGHLLPQQMSGGMRGRVAIARAMAAQPSILLVDEPFSALDKNTAIDLRKQLQTIIAQSNLATIWVTHDLAEIEAVSEQQLFLHGNPGSWYTKKQGEHNKC